MEDCSEDSKEAMSPHQDGTFRFLEGRDSLTDGDSLQYSGDDLSSDRSRSKGSTSTGDGGSPFIYPSLAAFNVREAPRITNPVDASSPQDLSFNFVDRTRRDPTMSHFHSSFPLKIPPRVAAVSSPFLKARQPARAEDALVREASVPHSHGRSSEALYPSCYSIFEESQGYGEPYAATNKLASFRGPTFPGHRVGTPQESPRQEGSATTSVGSASRSFFNNTATSVQSSTKSSPSYPKTSNIYGDATFATNDDALSHPRFGEPGSRTRREEAFTEKPSSFAAATDTFRIVCFRSNSNASIETASDIVSQESPATPRFQAKKTPSIVSSHHDLNPFDGQKEPTSGGRHRDTANGRQENMAFSSNRSDAPLRSGSVSDVPVRRSVVFEPGMTSNDHRREGLDGGVTNIVPSSGSSVGSIDSGIDLDEKTRNNIVASSTSMHVARRQSRLPLGSTVATGDDHSAATNNSGRDLDKKTRNSFIASADSTQVVKPRTKSSGGATGGVDEDEKSVDTSSSGIDLDDGIRNKIISRSTSMHMARRRNSMMTDDVKAPASTGTLRLGRESVTAAKVAPRPPPPDRKYSKRFSRRISGSSRSSSNRSSIRSRQAFDEKANFRSSWSGSVVGQSATDGSVGSNKRLSLEKQKANQDYDGLPFLPVRATSIGADTEDPDVEAHAGLPVVLPGAFAVRPRSDDDLIEDSESDFDENTIVTVDNPIQAEETPDLQSEISDHRPTFQPVVPAAPVDAELYEEAEVAEVIDETSNTAQKISRKRARYLQIFLGLMTLAIAGAVVLALFRPSKEDTNSVCKENCDIKIEGWTELGGVLIGPLDNDNIQYGHKVAMSADGNRVAVGFPGRDAEDDAGFSSPFGGVFVMDYNGTDWTLVQDLSGFEADGRAGTAVAISQDGTRVAVGAPGTSGGGYTAIYSGSANGEWSLLGEILREDNFTGTKAFGSTLALSAAGDTVVVGDIQANVGDNVPDAGIVRVYGYDGTKWTQIGSDIPGTTAEELFGWSVALSDDGKRVAASAIGTGGSKGEVRIFDLKDGEWHQVGATLIGETEGERFGFSISLGESGNRIAVGAPGHSAKKGVILRDSGRVRSFAYDADDDEWKLVGQPIDGENQADQFGSAVAMSYDGSTVAIGSPQSSIFGATAGFVQIIKLDQDAWVPIGSILGRLDGDGGLFGSSVDISADGMRVVGGAPDFTYDGKLSKAGLAWAYQSNIA